MAESRFKLALRRAFAEVDPFNPGNCPRLLWASFAFVNNMLPFAGCASHTWSTAVQMQFFLLAPLVLLLLRPALPGFRYTHVPSSIDNSHATPNPVLLFCPAAYNCPSALAPALPNLSNFSLDLTLPRSYGNASVNHCQSLFVRHMHITGAY